MPRRRLAAAPWIVAAGAAALLLLPRASATLDPLASDAEAAAALSRVRARAAATAIASSVEVQARDAAGAPRAGTGIVVDPSGFVLTALHVVEGASGIRVTAEEGVAHAAQIHATDARADLALLRLLTPRLRLAAARIVSDEPLEPGESLLAVGSPYGLPRTVSSGILSARDRRGVYDDVVPLLQTDLSVHPGSSGGPLVNLRGEVVGLVTAVLRDRGFDLPIAFAVPGGEILRSLPSMFRGGAVARPWLGLRLVRREETLLVEEVTPGGPADRAGVRAGDRLLAIGGMRAATLREARERIGALNPGDAVAIDLERGPERLRPEISVGTLP